MKTEKRWLTSTLSCVLSLGSCTSTPEKVAPLGFHDYRLEVEDTNPMVGVESAFIISIYPNAFGRQPYQQGEQKDYAALYYYSRYYTVKQPEGWLPATRQIPMDTVRIGLSREQVVTIYQRTREVFSISALPELYNPKYPLRLSSHDLDNYLVVRFAQPSFGGPTLQCSGYKDNNWAAYSLATYLQQLQTRGLSDKK